MQCGDGVSIVSQSITYGMCFSFFFFFFKQKTAYEIVDCDWSSDVCSSDLVKGVELKVLHVKVITSHNVIYRCVDSFKI